MAAGGESVMASWRQRQQRMAKISAKAAAKMK
jgi:hypothetical protein